MAARSLVNFMGNSKEIWRYVFVRNKVSALPTVFISQGGEFREEFQGVACLFARQGPARWRVAHLLLIPSRLRGFQTVFNSYLSKTELVIIVRTLSRG